MGKLMLERQAKQGQKAKAATRDTRLSDMESGTRGRPEFVQLNTVNSCELALDSAVLYVAVCCGVRSRACSVRAPGVLCVLCTADTSAVCRDGRRSGLTRWRSG